VTCLRFGADPATGSTAYESDLRDQSAALSILCLWLPLGCEIQPLTNPRPNSDFVDFALVTASVNSTTFFKVLVPRGQVLDFFSIANP